MEKKYYQRVQPEIAIIWSNEMSMYNTHIGERPIGIQVYGKDFIHNLGIGATKKERTILQFSGAEHIREEWREKYLVLTPDLQSYQIISKIDDAFGSWSELFKDRPIIIIR